MVDSPRQHQLHHLPDHGLNRMRVLEHRQHDRAIAISFSVKVKFYFPRLVLLVEETQFLAFERRRSALRAVGFDVPAAPDFNWITRHNSRPLSFILDPYPQNKKAARRAALIFFFFLSISISISIISNSRGVNRSVWGKYICRELSKLGRKVAGYPLDKVFPWFVMGALVLGVGVGSQFSVEGSSGVGDPLVAVF